MTICQQAVWFTINENASAFQVLAYFISGQGQHARMLARLVPPQG